ncbi:MAG TPA: class I SAM-dependent methyltransferase [Planctomycetota bacterium]|nr:class I SAM-dependent methyltransferase [Planctomycetota bacterium]
MVNEVDLAPRAIGTPDVALHRMLKSLEAYPVKTVLDAPCGRGRLTHFLLQKGYDVSASDILPDLLEVGGVECRQADLNQGLPYADASFDAVLSPSGLHRIWAMGRAIAEYARVLKPGGVLLVTVPNFSKMSRRLRFLMTGVNSWAVVRLSAEQKEPAAHFRQPAVLPQILHCMDVSGLELKGVGGCRKSPRQWLSLPLVPLARFGYLFISARKRKQYFLRETSSFPALFSDFVLIEAQKPAARPGAD